MSARGGSRALGLLLVLALASTALPWFGVAREPIDATPSPLPPPFRFPPGFLWGTATAAGQVEAMRGSDWDDFVLRARAEGRDAVDENGQAAAGSVLAVTKVPINDGGGARRSAELRPHPVDQLRARTGYDEKYAEDLAFAASMGTSAYRFSIAWERLFPTADTATPDPAGLAFYQGVLDACARHGLTPMVTLQHFTTPAWLWQDRDGHRGWERADALSQWDRFVRAVVAAYGDRVAWWVTLNEPMVYVYFGWLEGAWPPLLRSKGPAEAAPVLRRLLEAHAAAYRIVHEDASRRGREAHVGIAQHIRAFQPLRTWDALDRITAGLVAQAFDWDLLDALHTGTLKMTSTSVAEPVPGLAGTEDFVGLNYYGRQYVRTSLRHPTAFTVLQHDPDANEPVNDLGWNQYPRGLHDAILAAEARYRLPIVITENGTADAAADDQGRQRQLVRDLREVGLALREGARVAGYFHWSLTDIFEWAQGFGPRLGSPPSTTSTGSRAGRGRGRGALCAHRARGGDPADMIEGGGSRAGPGSTARRLGEVLGVEPLLVEEPVFKLKNLHIKRFRNVKPGTRLEFAGRFQRPAGKERHREDHAPPVAGGDHPVELRAVQGRSRSTSDYELRLATLDRSKCTWKTSVVSSSRMWIQPLRLLDPAQVNAEYGSQLRVEFALSLGKDTFEAVAETTDGRTTVARAGKPVEFFVTPVLPVDRQFLREVLRAVVLGGHEGPGLLSLFASPHASSVSAGVPLAFDESALGLLQLTMQRSVTLRSVRAIQVLRGRSRSIR